MFRDDLLNKEWCDIIFDGKNKSYGAYKIRKSSAKRHTFALIWVFGAVALFFFLPTIIIGLMSLGKGDDMDISHVISLTKMEKPPVIKIKEVKPHVDLSPKEPDMKLDKEDIKNEIKFVAPIIADDNEVTEQDIAKSQQAFVNSKEDILPEAKKDTAQYALPEELTPNIPDDKLHYEVIDELPQFPGGQQALMTYLSANIQYPFWAQRYNMQGQVTIQFIVNADGSLTNCRIIKGAGVYLDNEALRVVRSMPKWTPAKKKGKSIRSRCVIPVVFRLN
jgi:protein TonB